MVLLEILYKMSKIVDDRPHWFPIMIKLFIKKWSPFLIFATVLCCAYHVFAIYLGKLVDSVYYIAGRSNATMSWIFLEIPPGIS